MLPEVENKIKFILALKKSTMDLNKHASNFDVDNLKKLFIDNAWLLTETKSLNDVIAQLITLSERDFTPDDKEHFISLISFYWIELLLSAPCHVLTFGCDEMVNKLSEVMSENVSEINHIHIDKNTNLEEISINFPEGVFAIAIYDDAGSEILKIKNRFAFLSLFYIDEVFYDGRRKSVKEEIAYLLDKHDSYRKKHSILLPLHEFIINRQEMYSRITARKMFAV